MIHITDPYKYIRLNSQYYDDKIRDIEHRYSQLEHKYKCFYDGFSNGYYNIDEQCFDELFNALDKLNGISDDVWETMKVNIFNDPIERPEYRIRIKNNDYATD